MGRQKTHVVYNNFVKGLITEASDINFPAQASLDESNCVLFRKGNRRRRLGIDYVSGTSLSSNTFSLPSTGNTEFSYYRWKAPGGDGSLVFTVFQIGGNLYFYDSVLLTQIGVIDLTVYAISGGTGIANDKVKMVASRGKLFVVAAQLDPFYVTFVSPSTLNVTSITLNIRDLVGIDDGLAVTVNPPTLSPEHNYNILNQGWYPNANGTNLISQYFSDKSHYPANNQIWYLGRNSSDDLDSSLLEKQIFGNTPAPKGHYLINPFFIDRSAVSGVTGIAPISLGTRPSCVESFAGRVFYSGVDADGYSGIVYFSHILDADVTNAGNCYQVADPTSANDSELVDDDGGTIPIADIGKIIDMKTLGDTLCVFATNGVWGITGGTTGSSFKATDFSAYQITDVELSSIDSVVTVETQILYWSHTGIYAVVRDNISGRFNVQSISLTTIQSLFLGITSSVRLNVQAIYDEKNKQVMWLYSATDNDTSYTRTRVLLLDLTLNAFFKYDLSSLASNSPIIIGGIDSENTNLWYTSSLRMLTAIPSSGTYKFIFSEFKNSSFYDWFTANGTGITYSSYLEAGYEYAGDVMLNKQLPYILAYFEQTETAFVSDGTGYQLVNPSSCYMQAKWDFADAASSNRWSEEKQVYRLQRLQLPDTSDLSLTYGQSVIVTKNKIRGKGRAIRTRWRSEDGKDFNLLGWGASYTGDADV